MRGRERKVARERERERRMRRKQRERENERERKNGGECVCVRERESQNEKYYKNALKCAKKNIIIIKGRIKERKKNKYLQLKRERN